MSNFNLHQSLALLSLLVALYAAFRMPRAFVWTLALAIAGTMLPVAAHLGFGWAPSLNQALWACVAVTAFIFAIVVALRPEALGLSRLLLPYLFVIALLATLTAASGASLSVRIGHGLWSLAHIGIAVLTYGLMTLAAVAGLALFLRERALKRKQLDGWTRQLPNVADCERLENGLIAGSAIVLGAGLASGIAARLAAGDTALSFDHKTVFSIAAFAALLVLLALQRSSGLRGRRAARIVLLAYVLLTLGYIGVKIVRQVILA